MSVARTDDSQPVVVVGVDGSTAGISAARWAAREAALRHAPLRLTYVMDAGDNQSAANKALSAAEAAVRTSERAVNGPQTPIAIEVNIQRGEPVAWLINASRYAALVCVGAGGVEHSADLHIGAGVVRLATMAQCPVAVIRPGSGTAPLANIVVIEISETDCCAAVIELGIAEARLRGAPLQIVSTWRPRFTDVQNPHGRTEGNRRTRIEMERRLNWLRDSHPDLLIKISAERGTTANYLHRRAASIELLIVARARTDEASGDLRSPVHEALVNTDCSVLICPARCAG